MNFSNPKTMQKRVELTRCQPICSRQWSTYGMFEVHILATSPVKRLGVYCDVLYEMRAYFDTWYIKHRSLTTSGLPQGQMRNAA